MNQLYDKDSLLNIAKSNLIRHPLTIFPFCLGLNNAIETGNSAGFDSSLLNRALGEFLERRYFYNEIKHDLLTSYHQVNPPILALLLDNLLNQLKQTQDSPANAVLHLNRVTNVFTQASAYLPTTFFALGKGYENDRRFIPFIDSSGQATHFSIPEAFNAALLEFIERQALLAAWYTGNYTQQIALDNLAATNKLKKFLTVLTTKGELICLNISGIFKAHVLLLIYFAKNKKDIVQYAIAAAAALTTQEAFYKASLELWQTYQFIYLNVNRHDRTSSRSNRFEYLINLLSFNHVKTKTHFLFDWLKIRQKDCAVGLSEYFCEPPSTIPEVLQSIKTISSALFALQAQGTYLDKTYYYCKVISPEFYLHIGTHKPLNHYNAFAKMLNIDQKQLRLHAIPFP